LSSANTVDADPAYHFDADPDPAYHFDADPDPTFQFDEDQDPQHWWQGLPVATVLLQNPIFGLVKVALSRFP
jgi:hypothetical protein